MSSRDAVDFVGVSCTTTQAQPSLADLVVRRCHLPTEMILPVVRTAPDAIFGRGCARGVIFLWYPPQYVREVEPPQPALQARSLGQPQREPHRTLVAQFV